RADHQPDRGTSAHSPVSCRPLTLPRNVGGVPGGAGGGGPRNVGGVPGGAGGGGPRNVGGVPGGAGGGGPAPAGEYAGEPGERGEGGGWRCRRLVGSSSTQVGGVRCRSFGALIAARLS